MSLSSSFGLKHFRRAVGDGALARRLVDAVEAAAGAASAPQGNGLLVGNGRQVAARSLVPGPGIAIDNPTGIDGDPRIAARPGRLLLAQRAGVNLNTTADQAIQIVEYVRYVVTEIWLFNRSATPAAAAGGFYTAPGKTGFVLVPATQTYDGLFDAGKVVACALGPDAARVLTGPNIYLSLTTPEGAACTADVLVWGYWLPAPAAGVA